MKIIAWWWWWHGDDQVLRLGKKKEKNKKLKAKVYFVGAILFWWSHLGLIAVLLRGVKLISECGYQSATRCSNSLHMHLESSGVLTPLKMFVKICEHMCTRWYTWWLAHLSKGEEVRGEMELVEMMLASVNWPDAGSLSDLTLKGYVWSCCRSIQ